MGALVALLVFCQALGALGGALAVVWGELAYVRAVRDGTIDAAEQAHLHAIANALRYGMFLLLLSSLGLIIIAYALRAPQEPALSAGYWVLIVLAFLVIGGSWALSSGRVSFAFGSAFLFAGWWFLAYLALGRMSPMSFGATAAFFAVATAVFYVILQSARFLALHTTMHRRLAQRVK